MANITRFNKLHLELIPRLWSGEKILLTDYFKMLSDVGVDTKKIPFPPKKFPEGVQHLFRIENEETIKGVDELGQSISRLISYVALEKIDGNYFLVSVEPSSHLCKWLWHRNRSLEYKEMQPVKPIDAILEKACEISLLFIQHRQKFEKPVSGETFLAFLEEHKLSPFIWFWDYCDRENSGYSSTTLSETHSCIWVPIPKLRVEFTQSKNWKNETLAGRSRVIVKIDL